MNYEAHPPKKLQNRTFSYLNRTKITINPIFHPTKQFKRHDSDAMIGKSRYAIDIWAINHYIGYNLESRFGPTLPRWNYLYAPTNSYASLFSFLITSQHTQPFEVISFREFSCGCSPFVYAITEFTSNFRFVRSDFRLFRPPFINGNNSVLGIFFSFHLRAVIQYLAEGFSTSVFILLRYITFVLFFPLLSFLIFT